MTSPDTSPRRHVEGDQTVDRPGQGTSLPRGRSRTHFSLDKVHLTLDPVTVLLGLGQVWVRTDATHYVITPSRIWLHVLTKSGQNM